MYLLYSSLNQSLGEGVFRYARALPETHVDHGDRAVYDEPWRHPSKVPAIPWTVAIVPIKVVWNKKVHGDGDG